MNFNFRLKKLKEITTAWVNYFKLADMRNNQKNLICGYSDVLELVYGKRGRKLKHVLET